MAFPRGFVVHADPDRLVVPRYWLASLMVFRIILLAYLSMGDYPEWAAVYNQLCGLHIRYYRACISTSEVKHYDDTISNGWAALFWKNNQSKRIGK